MIPAGLDLCVTKRCVILPVKMEASARHREVALAPLVGQETTVNKPSAVRAVARMGAVFPRTFASVTLAGLETLAITSTAHQSVSTDRVRT